MNARTRPLDLDALAAMTTPELTDLYREGTVPESLDGMDGEPTCRMLAIRGVARGRLFDGVRRVAAAGWFPWGGKAFRGIDASHGEGINRVRLPGRELRWYPFDTRVVPSAIDGAPCVFLDYDRPDNPAPIRMIRDELREVAPDLFVGPAMLDTKRGKAPRLVLYFACDFGPARR